MEKCLIPIVLAYIAAIYIGASIIYLLTTYIGNVGTPLKDAIMKDPELAKLRENSKSKRGKIFLFSLLISLSLLLLIQPFKPNNDYNDIFISGYE